MSNSNADDLGTAGRRSFFRLLDRVYVEYRPVTKEEVDKALAARSPSTPPKDDFNHQLDQLSTQLHTLTASIRSEDPAVAQYLEVLNRKVDLLAGVVFFDRFRNIPGDGKRIRTTTVDISEGGVSFNSRTPRNIGDYLDLRLAIVGARLGLRTFGRIVQCIEKTHDGTTYHRLGAEFVMMQEYDRRQIARFIMDRQRERIQQEKDEH